jgi:DNA-nicking Smr family endonuclease
MAKMPKKRKSPPRKEHTAEFENHPLAGLKKLLPAHAAKPHAAKPHAAKPPKPAPPRRAKAEPSNDEELFLAAVGGAHPLNLQNFLLPPPPRIKPPASLGNREAEEVMQTLQDLVNGEAPFSIHETEQAIEGTAEGLDPRIVHKLRSGEFAVQDHLDLHGRTRDEAQELVRQFLLNSLAQSKRCVLIIHGRGHGSKDHIPVLKNALRAWFTRGSIGKRILAFTTARPCDGGAGAVYVLLRKPKAQP